MCLTNLGTVSPNNLGDTWYRKFHDRIASSLKIDAGRDRISRDILSKLLNQFDRERILEALRPILYNQVAFVFGAGPSLDSDIAGVKDAIDRNRPVIVAADGAADALYEVGLEPRMLVTDLDSCSLESLQLNSRHGCVFVHAHGDNIELVRRVVPSLGSNTFGTTQVESVRNVWNFGGFTDGDRACYVANYFSPSCIVIAGMDFGSEEGHHSKSRYEKYANPNRRTKMIWGKKSLEFLVQKRPDIRFLNITKFGEELDGVEKKSYEVLISELA